MWVLGVFALGHAGRCVSACLLSGCCCYAKQPESQAEVATDNHDLCFDGLARQKNALRGQINGDRLLSAPSISVPVDLFPERGRQLSSVHLPKTMSHVPSGPSRPSTIILHGEVKSLASITAVDMTYFAYKDQLLQFVRPRCKRTISRGVKQRMMPVPLIPSSF